MIWEKLMVENPKYFKSGPGWNLAVYAKSLVFSESQNSSFSLLYWP